MQGRMRDMRLLDERKFVLLNILIPIVLGGIIYITTSQDVLFMKFISGIVNVNKFSVNHNAVWFLFLRNYLADILWGYALVFAIYIIMDSAATWKLLGVVFPFSILMEMLQILDNVPGTFDYWDIVVEAVAEMIAVIIIKIVRRKLGNEKQGKMDRSGNVSDIFCKYVNRQWLI